MDSAGLPQWSANGKLFYQQNAKEVWLMKAVSWQNGILVAWIQGGYGAGGDTLYCNFYNNNGVSQWTQPTVVANKQGSIIYVSSDNLDIYPNDSGATITYGLTQSGGNSYFSFNRIDFSGNLHWPLDLFSYQGGGYYYQTASDNYNGFYVATTTGGLGAHIFLGHFDLQGNLTIPAPVDVCGTAGGRGSSGWKVLCDADTNAYIVWSSYTNNDVSIAKIKPNGTLPWPDAKQICAAAGSQDNPDAIINGNTIYAVWSDGRPTAVSNYDIYMQKLDTAGTGLWTSNGILLSHVASFYPVPKLVSSGNNVVATYVVGGVYRGQQIQPDSTVTWYQNGVVINTNNPPFYGDYQLVSSSSGSVTAIWREDMDQICAARVKPNGTLTNIVEQSPFHFTIYPNPFSDKLIVNLPDISSAPKIEMYDALGRKLNIALEIAEKDYILNTKQLAKGIYILNVLTNSTNQKYTLIKE
ncbi:MAG: T9SS type A sorting domain-containing protein [Bacteroidetes bacterium]|nr:T9SS type A sorting domain-containing protein [Bacteroidota bacterium]